MTLTAEERKAFLDQHIPHRLCLLTTFRDRQTWFKEPLRENDCDFLRVSKDSALLSIRMFADFLGMKPGSKRDDVSVEMLGGKRVKVRELNGGERSLLRGLCGRANKELAHLTSTFTGHDEFNTARALVEGIDIIERLLRTHLYDPLNVPFPSLREERRINLNHWQFVDGPRAPVSFPKR